MQHTTEFITSNAEGEIDLPVMITDEDQINLANVVQSAIPRLFNNLFKEYCDHSG